MRQDPDAHSPSKTCRGAPCNGTLWGVKKPNRIASPENLVWIDLEMTGLDVNTEVILQAAVIITDNQLAPLEEFVCDIWQPESRLQNMSPFVRDMHTKTGLLERSRASRIDTGDAEKRLIERVAGWCTYPATVCGNTIWQDRRFIEKHMPGLDRILHYRMVDVSAFKILASRWYADRPAFAKSKDGEHDALVDIRNSIGELAHYRKTILQ